MRSWHVGGMGRGSRKRNQPGPARLHSSWSPRTKSQGAARSAGAAGVKKSASQVAQFCPKGLPWQPVFSGQGSALYDQGLVFRPDYEVVFAAILDLATERREVDRERIALSGRSFGGYLAPRAACFENRVRALIADPGLYDLGSQVRAMVPSELWAQVEASAPEAELPLQRCSSATHAASTFSCRVR